MKTERISAENLIAAIVTAREVFEKKGGIVAFPTDTVYGIGAPVRSRAIEYLFEAKGRPYSKPIGVLMADASGLPQVAAKISDHAKKLAQRFWPGPLTLVLPRHPEIAWFLSKNDTIGIRVPDHPVAHALLAAIGPMAVTSANRSGQENALNADQVMAQLNGWVHLVIDGGQTPGDQPSTVVDMTGEEPKILRVGPISEAEIRAALA
jgi:L-threonylcarbamoyladenylate synthase